MKFTRKVVSFAINGCWWTVLFVLGCIILRDLGFCNHFFFHYLYLWNVLCTGSASSSASGEIPGQPQNRTPVIIPIICGAIPFCEQPANHLCHITPVRSCNQCSLSKGGVFVFFFVLLALAIVIGNALIICVGWIRYRKKTLNKTDISKSSLAVGDMLIGQ